MKLFLTRLLLFGERSSRGVGTKIPTVAQQQRILWSVSKPRDLLDDLCGCPRKSPRLTILFVQKDLPVTPLVVLIGIRCSGAISIILFLAMMSHG